MLRELKFYFYLNNMAMILICTFGAAFTGITIVYPEIFPYAPDGLGWFVLKGLFKLVFLLLDIIYIKQVFGGAAKEINCFISTHKVTIDMLEDDFKTAVEINHYLWLGDIYTFFIDETLIPKVVCNDELLKCESKSLPGVGKTSEKPGILLRLRDGREFHVFTRSEKRTKKALDLLDSRVFRGK